MERERLLFVAAAALLDGFLLWTLHRAWRTGAIRTKYGVIDRHESPRKFYLFWGAQALFALVAAPVLIVQLWLGRL